MNEKLAKRIADIVSDGFDDEEYREQTEHRLINKLNDLDNNSEIRGALIILCEMLEEARL